MRGARWEFAFAYNKALYDLLIGGLDIRPLIRRRGMPRRISFDTAWAYYYRIEQIGRIGERRDETLRRVGVGTALRWLRSGRSHLHPHDEWLISDPRAYFPTWLTTSELAHICAIADANGERSVLQQQLRTLTATMRSLDARPHVRSRLVLWFVC